MPLSGRGKLYSQTVVHAAPAVFRDEVPYRVGIVDLDESLRIATRVLAKLEPKLDSVVEIVVLNYRDGPLFAARPVPRPDRKIQRSSVSTGDFYLEQQIMSLLFSAFSPSVRKVSR